MCVEARMTVQDCDTFMRGQMEMRLESGERSMASFDDLLCGHCRSDGEALGFLNGTLNTNGFVLVKLHGMCMVCL